MFEQKKEVFFSFCKVLKGVNLATKITLLRIVIILPILFLLSFGTKITTFFACILFVLASLSDLVDGYIARKYGQVTTLGKFLDPLADKLLVCTILIELVALSWVASWVVHIVIIRELAVTGLRAVAVDHGIVLAADTYGKWKTTFQLFALVPLMLHFSYFGIPMQQIGNILLYIAVFFTILSGFNYFYIFYKELKKHTA